MAAPLPEHIDPIKSWMMQPPSAASPMDLQVLSQPPLALPPVEDISPALESHLASALASLDESQLGPDPFERSALLGFEIPAVGSTSQ